MKKGILLATIVALFAAITSANAQSLGLEVVPASTNTGGREALVITYTELENRQVELFEAVVPASSQAGCLAATDFSNAVPIPAERTAQTWGEGKKVVIVFVKHDTTGPCHVILGRSGVSIDDFNVIRANFGRTLFVETGSDDSKSGDSEADARQQSTPAYKIVRKFPI